MQRAVILGNYIQIVIRSAVHALAVFLIVCLGKIVIQLHGHGRQYRVLRDGHNHAALFKDRIAACVAAGHQVIAVKVEQRPADDNLVFVVGLKGCGKLRGERFGKFLGNAGGQSGFHAGFHRRCFKARGNADARGEFLAGGGGLCVALGVAVGRGAVARSQLREIGGRLQESHNVRVGIGGLGAVVADDNGVIADVHRAERRA